MKHDQELTWNDLGHFGVAQYLTMHALTFRTQVLRDSHLTLPKHTFYVDFLYSYQPLPWVHRLRYLNIPLYHYFIGREGQSVQTDVMISRVDQLIHVNKLMLEAMPDAHEVIEGLYRYMIHYYSINSLITSVFLILSKKDENYEKKAALWDYMKKTKPVIARDVKKKLTSRAINLPGKWGRFIVRQGYTITRGIIGFN